MAAFAYPANWGHARSVVCVLEAKTARAAARGVAHCRKLLGPW